VNLRTDENSVRLRGRLTRDPEPFYFEGGNGKVNLSVATGKNRKVDGEWKKETEYHRVVVFVKDQEDAAPLMTLAKGSAVSIKGENKTRSYGEGDNKRYVTEIITERFGGVVAHDRTADPSNPEAAYASDSDHGSTPDDDIPF
jgi:single stranded DNA-binding protein